MDSNSATLKANGNPIRLRRESLRNRASSVFWGESLKGKGRDLKSKNLQKSLKTIKKPGLAYSILTPDVEKEALVSESKIIIRNILMSDLI